MPLKDISLRTSSEETVKMSEHYGIAHRGYVVVVNDNKSNRSCITFNSNLTLSAWRSYVEANKSTLIEFGSVLHNIAIEENKLHHNAQSLVLSRREQETLTWIAEGKSYPEISVLLGLSENTLKSYAKSARLKLDSVTISQAVSRAVKLGLI